MIAAGMLGCVAGALGGRGRGARLSILIYHRVLQERDSLFPSAVDAATFDAHMGCLAASFNVLPLAVAVDRLQEGTLPPRAVCVTFDDGYADNAEIALPILQRHRVHATFFIATGFLDGGCMFNDRIIQALRSAAGGRIDLTPAGCGVCDLSTPAARRETIETVLAAVKYATPVEREARAGEIARIAGAPADVPRLMMGSAQVRLLHRAGMAIGAHTVTHPILARIDAASALAEMTASRRRLEQLIDAPVALFAYPNGKPGIDYRGAHARMAREAGFDAAVSTAWGVATTESDVYQLPRFTPWDRSVPRFGWRLVGNLLRTAPALAD